MTRGGDEVSFVDRQWSGLSQGIFICGLLSLMLLGFVLRLPSPLISDFAFAHWLLSYDRGFIRRGLIGQICEVVFGQSCYTRSFIGGIAISVNLLYILFILVIICKLVRKELSPGVLILCVILSIYTGGIPLWAKDIGRLDVFLALIVILYYLLLTSCVAQSSAVLILSIIGILIHEIFIFVSFPMMVAIFAMQYQISCLKHCGRRASNNALRIAGTFR
jgi:hypothetical protein